MAHSGKTMTFKADLLPENTADEYNLGNATQKWKLNGGTPALVSDLSAYVLKAGDTMTGALEFTTPAASGAEMITFSQSAGFTELAICKSDDGTTRKRFAFRQYRPSGKYSETYVLPSTTNDITASANYDILTSKSAVTVAQGGTGAATAAEARANLGVGNAQANTYQLGSNGSKVQLTESGNTCIFTIKRAGTTSNPSAGALCIAEHWSAQITVLGELPSQIVLQKEVYSNAITIQNNRTTAVVLAAVSGTFAAVEGTDAITETAVRYYPFLPITGGTLTGNLTIARGTTYGGISITATSTSTRLNILNTGTRFTFDEYANGSTGGERYLLPTPSAHDADVWYNILTSKNVISITQGGTGRTTAWSTNTTWTTVVTKAKAGLGEIVIHTVLSNKDFVDIFMLASSIDTTSRRVMGVCAAADGTGLRVTYTVTNTTISSNISNITNGGSSSNTSISSTTYYYR